MLQGVNNFNLYNFGENPFTGVNLTANSKNHNDAIDEAIYGSDEFWMFSYKVKRCPRVRPHDWTDCPYAHSNEKARRRDPRQVPYCAIACEAYKHGKCPKGDSCQFSHGVFEYWLHPARYRTRVCHAGPYCQRKVCFFAHTPGQLRLEARPKCQNVYPWYMSGGDNQYHLQQQYIQYKQEGSRDVIASGGSSSGHEECVNLTSGTVPESPSSAPQMWRDWGDYRYDQVEKVLKSLRDLEISDNGGAAGRDEQVKKSDNLIGGEVYEQVKKSGHASGAGGGLEVSESDVPNFVWISDLLQ